METKNNLDPKIVHFVINKYYKSYSKRFYEDLYSHGLEALYDADKAYNPTMNTKPFNYFAVCLIRRHIFMFVRDKISKTYQNTTFIDNNQVLEILGEHYTINLQNIDLYRAIGTLNDEEKKILYLLYERGYTLEKVSKALGVGYRTAFRRHKRIINKLRKRLK